MIICSCNNISDSYPINKFKFKCGKCKEMVEEIHNSTILKSYKKYSLMYREEDHKPIYEVYQGYIKLKSFSNENSSAYKEAREYFDSLKEL